MSRQAGPFNAMERPTDPPPTGYFRGLWSLQDQAFIVLGAGNGMGLQTSRALKDLGASLVVVDREAALANRAAEELGGVSVVADVTDESGVAKAIEAAESSFGRVDGAVDIVGGATRATIDDLTLEQWERDFAVNVRHAYLIGHLLGPRLAKHGGGSLTFIASLSGHSGTHVTPAYSAAKAALINFVQSLAVTYGPSGVRANTVSPSTTWSDRMAAVIGDHADEWASMTALKSINQATDVAAAIAFLVSPAARTITGHDLVVDGGASARDPIYGDRRDSRFAPDLG
jgi:NAD(P)-dependent dehydrogenase (short-subunit alcohol dehydrogenase family)